METNEITKAWQWLMDRRRQCDIWDMAHEVPRETIEEIIRECWRRTPSKQNQMPFDITVWNWDHPDQRNAIYDWAQVWMPEEQDWGRNPQTLAPWLLCFRARPTDERMAEAPLMDTKNPLIFSTVEAGMIAAMIAHSAAARGLDVGFCRCSNNDPAPDCLPVRKDAHDFLFFMGIGVGTEQWRNREPAAMVHPGTGEWVGSILSETPEYVRRPKPDFDAGVRFV